MVLERASSCLAGQELVDVLKAGLIKALHKFREIHGNWPDKVEPTQG
jgi:hypothetical protein